LRNQPPNGATDIPKSFINLQSHKIVIPLGFSQVIADQSQNFSGDSFIPRATSEPFRNFVVQVVRPIFRQFEHFFKVPQGLLVSTIILIVILAQRGAEEHHMLDLQILRQRLEREYGFGGQR
jgi:hypothetical protein